LEEREHPLELTEQWTSHLQPDSVFQKLRLFAIFTEESRTPGKLNRKLEY
jgi:hypothetical protein